MVTPENSSWRRDLLWLVLGFGLLFGFRLGSYPLNNPDEGRNAEIPREMLATGDWVTPRLNGVNYFEKPPLVYWSVGACLELFGANEWAVRATPAWFALGGVLLTYAAARRLYGRTAGLTSATVLGTSLIYFGTGRFLVLDMPVSVLMSATLFCFILGVNEPPGTRRRWLFYGLYASAALATLTKGFIGFLVTGAVMFLWLLILNQWKRLRPMYLPGGVALFLVIAAPWHVLAAMRNETWAHRYIYFEHWARFTTTEHGRYQPWHYFIWILLGGLFPWVAFLWPAVRNALQGAGRGAVDRLGELTTGGRWVGGWARRRENATGWFLIIWVAFVFLFFSKSQSKLPAYILPVFPALAVIIGAWLAEVIADPLGVRRLRGGLRVFSFACGLLAIAMLIVVLRPGLVIRDPAQALALRTPAILLATILILGGVNVPILAQLRGGVMAFTAIAATAALFLTGLTYAVPDIYKPGTKELALVVKAQARPGDKVMHYYDFFHDFTFYAERTVGLIGKNKGELELEEDPAAQASGRFITDENFRQQWNGATRFWVVGKKRDVNALFADPTFHYHLLAQTRDHYLFSNQP